MFTIDARTLAVCTSITIGVMVVVSALLSLVYYKRYRGVVTWLWSNIFFALSFMLYSFQGYWDWNHFYTIVLSNSFAMFSFSLFAISIFRLVEVKVNYFLYLFLSLFAFGVFLFLENVSLKYRVASFSILAAIIFFHSGIDLYRKDYRYKNNYFKGASFFSLFLALVFVARAFSTFYYRDVEYFLALGAEEYAISFFILMLILKVALNVEFILLVSSIALYDSDRSLTEARLSNAAKDKLFSIISHDMKNLFAGLLWLSDIILLKLSQGNFNRDLDIEKVKILNDAINRQYTLLENLLHWASSQSEKIEYNPEIVDMKYLSREMVLLYEELAMRKSISLQSEIHQSTYIFADKNMISTAFRNLINNAIKYTKESGQVKLYVTEDIENEIVQIIVEDTGIGIAEHHLEKLFHIDSNLKMPVTNQEKGTGLGLLVCKEFIEKNGGTIFVESEVGKGSKFTIVFKKSPPPPQQQNEFRLTHSLFLIVSY